MRVSLVLLLLVWSTDWVDADEAVDYQRDIKPLLSHKCGACHGTLKQRAGLRLDAGSLIHKGSNDTQVIVPGNAAASLLIQKVAAKDLSKRMPPEGQGAALNASEIAILSSWINDGALVPKDEIVPGDPRSHWAYLLPKRIILPAVADPNWAHPIDAFIAQEHQRLGLTPVSVADRETLLRRVYLDLIGLPPSREQLKSFLEDDSSDAWSKVVESLLVNPHYGERWGRHWMDVWRYSDWDGYKQQLRGSQRHIWRWRDWIVQSLNTDKGYDRMIVDMLAADEATPNKTTALPATGFLARNFHKSNRNMWLDATVEHTAKAFLGLTLNCARCHDHKFDPIEQTSYYQFRAIFEPHNVRTDRFPNQPNVRKDGLPRAYDADLSAQTFLYLQGNDKRPDKDHPMVPAVPALLGGTFDVQPIELPIEAYYPALATYVESEQLAAAKRQRLAAVKALASTVDQTTKKTDSEAANSSNLDLLELQRVVAELREESLVARFAADKKKYQIGKDSNLASDRKTLAIEAATIERQFKVNEAKLALRQKQMELDKAKSSPQKNAKKKNAALATAQKGLVEAKKNLKTAQEASTKTDDKYTPIGTEYPRTSSGRRLALARWIANSSNPLTARVAVNHIWLRHFGTPLVDNVFDFGLRSPKPKHADLLDWLAVEFMENDWSMKHLHRLIVTSRTWQLASSSGDIEMSHNRSVDNENHFLWRMNVRRLDAEIIRDNVLAVSGQLDNTLGGADIDFREGETTRRRSIYLRHAYEKQMTMLLLFDAASPNECYRRSESIIPQQALALMNSSLSLSQARLLAPRLWNEASQDTTPERHFIRLAFLQILSRAPLDQELVVCETFLKEQSATLSDTSVLSTFVGGTSEPKVKPATDPKQRARENLIQVLMNHNDFISVR